MLQINDTWVLGQLETNGDYAASIRADIAEQERRDQSTFGDGKGTKLRQYFGFNVEYVSQKNGAKEVRVSDSKRNLIGSRIVLKTVFESRPAKFEEEVLWAAALIKNSGE